MVAVGVGVVAADFVGVGAGVLDARCVTAALGFEVSCALLVAVDHKLLSLPMHSGLQLSLQSRRLVCEVRKTC